jgi:uncharacterized protein
MRRSEKEITDKEIIEEIISLSEVCRIAMFDKEFPYIVPLNYGFSENSIYFHSASTGKKIDLLKKNNKVCFEIDYSPEIVKNELSCKWTTKYRSVTGTGTIEIVTDFEDKKEGLNIIMGHYGRHDNLDYNFTQVNNIVILKLSITQLTGKQSGDWE